MRGFPRLAPLAVLILLVGCDAAPEPSEPIDGRAPATLEELLGPWSPTPYVAPPAVLAAADRACRGDMDTFPIGIPLVLVDVRGGGLAQAYFAGANGGAATCNDMPIDGQGRVTTMGGGSTTDPGQPTAPLGQFEIRLTDVSARGVPAVTSQVAGPVGAGIVRVEVVRPGQPVVEASLANGWFAAWVPSAWPPGWSVRGFDANGAQVANAPGP